MDFWSGAGYTRGHVVGMSWNTVLYLFPFYVTESSLTPTPERAIAPEYGIEVVTGLFQFPSSWHTPHNSYSSSHSDYAWSPTTNGNMCFEQAIGRKVASQTVLCLLMDPLSKVSQHNS